MDHLSIVVPIFNEVESVAVTTDRLARVSDGLKKNNNIAKVTLVLVNDGSTDGTSEALKELPQKHQHQVDIKVLEFSRNFGHSAAVFAGLESADGSLVAIVDADLQDPPELLGEMIDMLRREKADVVYGKRRKRSGETVFKKFTAWAFYRLINAMSGTDIPRDTGDFRVITKQVRDVLVELQESEPFLRGLVAWVGYKQLPFAYDRQPRLLGETKYPFKRMFRFALQAMMSFSSLPLKAAVYLGLAGAGLTILAGLYALAIWWQGTAVPGWTSLVIGFAFGQSLTFLMIGVLGLYLGRVHTAVQKRPRYILRKG